MYEAAPPWLLEDRYKKRGQSQRQVEFKENWMESFQRRIKESPAANEGGEVHEALQRLTEKYQVYMVQSKVRL